MSMCIQHCWLYDSIMRGSRNFRQGEEGQKKNSDNVFRHQLFYSLKEGYQWFILNKTIFFIGSRGVPTFYRGAGPNFSGGGGGGGGGQMLI